VLHIPDQPGGACSLRTIPLAANALTNGANYSSSIWPGMIATIFGANSGSTTDAVAAPVGGKFPTTVGNTQVFFNGVAGPMIYSTKNQVSAIAPFNLLAGGVPIEGKTHVYIEINNNGKLSTILDMAASGSSAGVFTLDRTGSGQAAAINQDGTVNDAAHPVPRGQAISLYATGLGQTNPPLADGVLGPSAEPFPRVTGNVIVNIGGQVAQVLYAGAAPQAVAGLTQINVLVPATVTPGPAVPISVLFGPTTQKVTIAVSQ